MAVRLTARIASPEPAGAVLRAAAADQGSDDVAPDGAEIVAPTAAQHTEILRAATAKVDKLEPRLASIIEQILRQYGDIAARNFTRWVTNPQAIVAAADWTAPFPDQLIDVDALVAAILAKTDPIRNALIQEVMTPALEQAGLKWNIHNPLIAGQLANTGDKVTHIASTTRDNIMKIIGRAADSGLTIPQTSKLIQEGMKTAAASRATMIARTELGRAVNGASLTATQMVSKETNQPYQKVWLTAPGAKWPRHEDYDFLDGQTVNLNEWFTVGTAELQFPGDPDGPPDETIMCRCALSYADVAPAGTIVLPDGTVIGTPTDVAETAIADNPLHAPLSPTKGTTANGLARSLRVQAKKIEPAISGAMRDTASRNGAKLAGYDFRLKGEPSLIRKIREDAIQKGMTEAQTAREIADTVRYTAQFDAGNYVEGSRAFLNDLEDQGFEVGKFKNTWQPDVPYAGINVQMVAPNGYKFELQFHTAESFELKNFVNHKLYEEWRLLDPQSARAIELNDKMTANTRLVPVPQGARTFEYQPGIHEPVPSPRGLGTQLAPAGPGGPGSVVSFSETTDYRAFNEALGENARPGFLAVHSPEDLAANRVYLSADGKAGYSITPGGDLQNVFRNEGGVKGAGRAAVHEAVQEGGARTLDAYDGFLPDLYQQEGFQQVGRMAWNDEFAPDGWDYGEYGRPDVVFMATNPAPGIEVKTFTDWDEAKSYSLEVSRPVGEVVPPPTPLPEPVFIPGPPALPAIKPPTEGMLDTLTQQSEAWRHDLNANEIEAVQEYTSSAYRAINAAGRGTDLSDSEFRSEFGLTRAAARDVSVRIREALDKAPPLPDGVQIFRGLNPWETPGDLKTDWEKLGTPEAHTVGDYRDRWDPETLNKMLGDWMERQGIVKDAEIQPGAGGFQSFTLEPDRAATWGTDPVRPGIVFRVADAKTGATLGKLTRSTAEKEVLVPEHVTYRILSIKREEIETSQPLAGGEFQMAHAVVVNLEEVQPTEYMLADNAVPARIVTTANEGAKALMDGQRATEAAAGKTPDEAALAQGVKNWEKKLKDVIVTDPAAVQRVQAADAYNMANPLYAAQVGRRDSLIIVKDDTPYDNPLRPGGPATAAARREGNQATTMLEEATKIERTGPSIPGDASSADKGGLSALLRHEYGHSVSHKMSQGETVAFRAKLPDAATVKKDVTIYAAKGLETGNIQEAYSELFAITTDPAYRPSDWAKWVQDIGHDTWGAPLAERPTVEALITKTPTEAVKNLTPDLDTTGKQIDQALTSISDVLRMPEPQPYEIESIGTVTPEPLTAKIVGDIRVEGLPQGSKVQGTFDPKTNSIAVRRLTSDPRSVFTHEFGHALDHSVGQTLDAVHATDEIEKAHLEGWAQAITQSSTYQKIDAALKDGFARAQRAGLDPLGTDVVYVDGEPYYAGNLVYVMDPAEMFARSFTQYMSQTDEHIAAHVREKLGQQHQDPGMWYWQPDEFAPIADAMTNFLRDNGLLAQPEVAAEAEPSELLTHAVAEGAAEQGGQQPPPPSTAGGAEGG